MQPPLIPLPLLIEETAGRIQADPHLLPAALFRQAVHYASDLFTKEGLPVPLLGSFHETLAGELYASQYDFLCFARDAGLESASAVLSILINMVIGLLHGLYYNEERDGERKLYEVRTRKILLYANMLSAAGNTAVAAFTKDAKLLDIGGLVVTVSRLYTDSRFIARAKEEFIQQYLDEEWRRIEKRRGRYAVYSVTRKNFAGETRGTLSPRCIYAAYDCLSEFFLKIAEIYR